ncbi:MAG: hypothetical protein ACR9NN_13215 [Nostochopsis sp.]
MSFFTAVATTETQVQQERHAAQCTGYETSKGAVAPQLALLYEESTCCWQLAGDYIKGKR